jgi:hypothetical protein
MMQIFCAEWYNCRQGCSKLLRGHMYINMKLREYVGYIVRGGDDVQMMKLIMSKSNLVHVVT